MSKIGFIGLGIMGTPMARNLQDAGHTLFLHSRSGVKDRTLLKASGGECDSPKAVAAAADIIIIMVPDTPDVELVLFGSNGVAVGLTAGKVVVDMSSIAPLATKRVRPSHPGGTRLRLPRRAGIRRRDRREGRLAHHNGWRRGGGLRARQTTL